MKTVGKDDAYIVRDARASDVDVLVSFTIEEAREAEDYAADPAAVRRGVAAAFEPAPPSTYWLAEQGGAAVAAISVVTEWSNFRGGYYWWVQSLFVEPEHRGKGVLELLFDRVMSSARQAGALDLRLYAHEANPRALRVYDRLGFHRAPYVIMKKDIDVR